MNDDEVDKWLEDFRKEIEPGTDIWTAQCKMARRILQTCLGNQSEDQSISNISDIYDDQV